MWPYSAARLRQLYAGGRADPTARRFARLWAAVFGLGLQPKRWVTLEVAGRRSGRTVRFPLGMADWNGRWYLVPMLGAECNWVRNVRAAGGAAVLRRRRARPCQLVELPVAERGPIIKRYLDKVPGARPHVPVDRNAPPAAFDAIAARYPVFEVRPVAQGPRLTGAQVWRELERSSFAVIGYSTPGGEPRSSGVLYAASGHRLYVVVAGDSWKARHIAISGRVAVTVPVRRGGILALLMPIPPATISFHGTATVRPGGELDIGSLPHRVARLLPAERRTSSTIIEIHPEARFVTYGIGVPLLHMRHPATARATVPVRRGPVGAGRA